MCMPRSGVHPDHEDCTEPTVDELVALADHPKVVAIGETGLDYFRLTGDLEWQRERFRTHIRAARLPHKPLVIHTRAAADDTLRIMREEQAGEAGGVMHCFTESLAVAEAAIELGFYISFSGIVTFKNAAALREVAAAIPLERMLIETDSPYLAPVPHRGQTNQPGYREARGRRNRAGARNDSRSGGRGHHARISSGCLPPRSQLKRISRGTRSTVDYWPKKDFTLSMNDCARGLLLRPGLKVSNSRSNSR